MRQVRQHRQEADRLESAPGPEPLGDDDFWAVDVDILISPAAPSRQITEKNAPASRRIVAEA